MNLIRINDKHIFSVWSLIPGDILDLDFLNEYILETFTDKARVLNSQDEQYAVVLEVNYDRSYYFYPSATQIDKRDLDAVIDLFENEYYSLHKDVSILVNGSFLKISMLSDMKLRVINVSQQNF